MLDHNDYIFYLQVFQLSLTFKKRFYSSETRCGSNASWSLPGMGVRGFSRVKQGSRLGASHCQRPVAAATLTLLHGSRDFSRTFIVSLGPSTVVQHRCHLSQLSSGIVRDILLGFHVKAARSISATCCRSPFILVFVGDSSKDALLVRPLLSFLLLGTKDVNLSSSSHTSNESGLSPNTSIGKGLGEIIGLVNLNLLSRIVCIFADADLDRPGAARTKSCASLSLVSKLSTLLLGEKVVDLFNLTFCDLGVTRPD